MKTSLVPVLLLGGAAYFVWKWFSGSGTPSGTTTPGGAAGGGAGTGGSAPVGDGNGPPTGTSTTPPPSGPTPVLPLTHPDVRAATDASYAAQIYPGPLYSAYQWNWYRHDQGGLPIYDAADLIEDPDRPITAAEYHQRMQAAAAAGAQLSGLSGLGRNVFRFPTSRTRRDLSWLM